MRTVLGVKVVLCKKFRPSLKLMELLAYHVVTDQENIIRIRSE